jgi:hypothetical protein
MRVRYLQFARVAYRDENEDEGLGKEGSFAGERLRRRGVGGIVS